MLIDDRELVWIRGDLDNATSSLILLQVIDELMCGKSLDPLDEDRLCSLIAYAQIKYFEPAEKE